MEILPNALFPRADIKTLLRRGDAAVLYKQLSQDLVDKNIFLTLPAILYVERGTVTCRNHDGTYAEAAAGELICMSKDLYAVSDYISSDTQEPRRFSALLFFFDAEVVEANLNVLSKPEPAGSKPPVISASNSLAAFMHAVPAVYGRQPLAPELLNTKLQELIYLLLQDDDGSDFLAPLYSVLTTGRKRDIAQFMQQRYTLDLRIKDFAELCGRSESSFQREFKALFGKPVNQWLIEQRLNQAKHLLREQSQSVTEVALTVGYRNVSHFIHAYRQHFGHTPRNAQLTE